MYNGLKKEMVMGYIHIYTGNGKGKSTAAFGLALRALMSGKKVYIGQFVKDMAYNETKITDHFKDIEIEQLGKGCFIASEPTKSDVKQAEYALEHCFNKYKSNQYDLIILDELSIALHYGLVKASKVCEYFFNKKFKGDIVITGRYCPESLIKQADLVTEMKEIKHYYSQGVISRDGFDK